MRSIPYVGDNWKVSAKFPCNLSEVGAIVRQTHGGKDGVYKINGMIFVLCGTWTYTRATYSTGRVAPRWRAACRVRKLSLIRLYHFFADCVMDVGIAAINRHHIRSKTFSKSTTKSVKDEESN